MEQIDLFSAVDDCARQKELRSMFSRWQSLPPELLIPADDPQRGRVLSMLNEGYGFLWTRALHRCQNLPLTKYIWLNAVQPAEYWVLNEPWNPAGKHIESRPFCGADLKAGGGDVLLVKADEGWWEINGFLKGEEQDGRDYGD